VTRLQSRLDDLVPKLAGEQLDRLLDLRPILPAAIRLGDFVRTRVVELVVHGDDVAASIAIDADPPPDAAAVAADVLVETAARNHGALTVLRALTRRERCTAAVFPVL